MSVTRKRHGSNMAAHSAIQLLSVEEELLVIVTSHLFYGCTLLPLYNPYMSSIWNKKCIQMKERLNIM